MRDWITPAVLGAIVTSAGTYLATKRNTKTDVESLYTKEIRTLVNDLKEQNKYLTEKFKRLEDEFEALKMKMKDKDSLIEQLEKENKRLEEEVVALKSWNKEKEARIKELEMYGADK